MVRGEGRKTRTPGTFGSVDKRAKGYRARYVGPDGRRHLAPTLFLTTKDARAWLALRHAEIVKGQWMPPDATDRPAPRLTFATYAEQWLGHRTLKTRTREHYRRLLDVHLLPALGALPVAAITADDIRKWHAGLLPDAPTMRAHCYALARTIMGDAVRDGKAAANPCVIRGAGSAKRATPIRPATIPELTAIADAMPEPYRLTIVLGAWCAMRFGEIAELRRGDVQVRVGETAADHSGVVRIRRGVVRVRGGQHEVTTPKSAAGVRDVNVPPHLVPAVAEHLDRHVGAGADALLFPAVTGENRHLAPGSFNRWYYKAREAAGRPDLRFHDLRHSGAVLAAATGATLAELMGRLGHSTPQAALRYQHAAIGADKRIAAALSALLDNQP
ncbi:tyrosine-type recombinase/integrase [Mycolicibacter sinensis]|uniref:tyrosine-type recombinase/integrase n=1 Tax=Mycolicibacter sinensis (strain JDM601) TaxID=875328 RepID=UPI0007EB58B6|nr:tyrosine-type recombinase/integrase [Mycolicibacter sinensis]OBH20792.1 integrase [Mycolicibacter sinensis]